MQHELEIFCMKILLMKIKQQNAIKEDMEKKETPMDHLFVVMLVWEN